MTYTTDRLSAEDLLNILALSDNATAIYSTEDIRIDVVNEKMIAAWQKDTSVIGKSIEEALPELKGQPFFDILKNVWRTGITYNAVAMPADIDTGIETKRYHFNFEYRAIKKPDGSMFCILHTSQDVTDAVEKGHILKANEIELQKLNIAITRANRDLALSNHELNEMNDSLIAAQKDMSIMYTRLAASEEKFRTVAEQIPVAINVLRFRDLKIEFINDLFVEIWGKNVSTQSVIGKTLTEVNPEFIGQPFMRRLDDVYTTGITYRSNNEKAVVTRNGEEELRYYNVIYHPIKNERGEINGVLQIAADNTKEFLTTKHVQELNEELASINEELAAGNEELAAGNEELRSVNEEMQLIQDDLHKANNQLSESEERFRTMAEATTVLVAIADENKNATYFNKAWERFTGRRESELLDIGWIDLIHPDDRDQFVNNYLAAIENKTAFKSEFRIKNREGNYRWLLAEGPARFSSDGSFIGHISSSIDITELKRDDERKNDFIGMVSHELKTPLTSLNGYIEIVRLDLKNTGDRFGVSLLDKAVKQVSKMTTMINGFLNVSRLESGKLQIEKTRFDMAELVEDTKQETTDMYNNHRFIFHPVEETFVYADWDKIGHVLNNFISNAVKYSPYGSDINIACITVNGRAQVSVKDKGIGIAVEDQERLFERYYRVENKAVQSISGFGIGLYLCAEIISRNEGTIWVESEPGEGSTFYFSLPIVE